MASVTVAETVPQQFDDIVCEELNVKTVLRKQDAVEALLDTEITKPLAQEGLIREVIRNVQSARKQADLQVDDRIHLQLASDHSDLSEALAVPELASLVKAETLAIDLNATELTDAYASVVKVGVAELAIKLKPAE